MKILCIATENGLVPKYESDREEYRKVKKGSEVVVSVGKERNYEFHKKFFALLSLTFDNLPERLHDELNIHSVDDLLVRLKIDLGLYSMARYGNQSIVVPGSISFSKMDEYEFEKFYRRCTHYILDNYLKGVNDKQLEEEIWRFL